MYSRISSTELACPSRMQAIADMICPGVQYPHQTYGSYGNGELAPRQLKLVARGVGGVGRQDGLLRSHSSSLPLTGWKVRRQAAGLTPTIQLKILVK